MRSFREQAELNKMNRVFKMRPVQYLRTSYQNYDQRKEKEHESGSKGRRESTYDLVNKLRLNYIFYLSCLRRLRVQSR